MIFQKQLLCLFCMGLLWVSTACFAETFTVQNIEFQGLQRISRVTALSYLPVEIGQQFDTANSGQVINALFKTGFFQDVNVSRHNGVLIIRVVERPTIGSIRVTGNKDIPKDKLDEVLKQTGLAEGNVYDSAILDKMKKSLQTEYYGRGRYNAKITTSVTPQPRNRVAIQIEISEGRVAQVAQIQFIGNQAFSDKELRKQMELTTHHWWSFIKHKDQYSKQKLDLSLETLRNFYLDHGYIRFKVDATQVSLSPDKKHVDVVIRLTEGGRYTVKGYKLVGNLVLPEEKMRSLVHIEQGSVFSRKAVTEAGQAMGKALGNLGYALASINAQPDINDERKEVFITFFVEPGNRVYVRRITFLGNTKTEDIVLRRQLRQMEGSLVTVDKVQESKRRLDLLGYLERTEIRTKPVPNADDQVDLDFDVTEGPSAQAMVGAGYGSNGLEFNAGINQHNFLGTGKTLGINFRNTEVLTNYSITYNNPYYTPDGVQRGFDLYLRHSNPGNLNVAHYTTDSVGGSVNYRIPVTADDNVHLGYGIQDLHLNIGSDPSTELTDFVNENGTDFQQILLNGGWSRNGLDRANFPTRGLNQMTGVQISAPITADHSLKYYKLNYNAHYYHPIVRDWTFSALTSLGYGAGYGESSTLPFLVNYFAGGPTGSPGAVRGYAPNSLGPRDSNDEPLGGNLLTTGSLGIIFPNPYMERLRTTVFVDAGNVYSTQTDAGSGPLRFSTGVSVDWRVPIFNIVLNVSVAKALNSESEDDTEPFQFNIVTGF